MRYGFDYPACRRAVSAFERDYFTVRQNSNARELVLIQNSYFRHMVGIFGSNPFYEKYVHLPSEAYIVPNEIRHNRRLWPFFKDCLGALDGTFIPCSPPALERSLFVTRKGTVAQNCLFGCSFDFRFVYALTGWEGSASDARIYEAAHLADLKIPKGKYFLADAGYPSTPGLLVPYRNVRSRLAERGDRDLRFALSFSLIVR
jgi:hypothetical protein